MGIRDRRDDMTVEELIEELELRYPEKISDFERRHDAYEDPDSATPEEIDDLIDDLRSLLRI